MIRIDALRPPLSMRRPVGRFEQDGVERSRQEAARRRKISAKKTADITKGTIAHRLTQISTNKGTQDYYELFYNTENTEGTEAKKQMYVNH